jgi:hypothetical protein
MLNSQPSSDEQTAVKEIGDRLRACPAWSELTAIDRDSSRKIIEALVDISAYDLEIIRKGIAEYISQAERSQQGYDVAAMSRLFILNRVLFAVPEKAPRLSVQFFGGWGGVPSDSTHINLMWPLAYDHTGSLYLSGPYSGYFGETYLAIAEFDWLRDTFDRRQLGDVKGAREK